MKRKIALLVCLVSLMVFSGANVMAAAMEFSADLSMSAGNGKPMTGKVFVKGGKIRTIIAMMGVDSITIARQDKKVAWILMPEQKQYREMPLQPDAAHPTADMQYDTKELGSGRANGYDCKIIQYTFKNTSYSAVNWLASQINMPVRVQVKNKSGALVTTVDYTNIKIGPQADDLFEIPAGYSKMEN